MNKTLLIATAITSYFLASTSFSIADPDSKAYHLFTYQHGSQVAPDEWWISSARISALPTWNPGKEKMPLSVEDACKVASKWVKEKNNVMAVSLEIVEIFSINPNDETLKGKFVFKLKYKVEGTVDQVVCFVLMDGSVLEPIIGAPK